MEWGQDVGVHVNVQRGGACHVASQSMRGTRPVPLHLQGLVAGTVPRYS